jgi:hypothetical protein
LHFALPVNNSSPRAAAPHQSYGRRLRRVNRELIELQIRQLGCDSIFVGVRNVLRALHRHLEGANLQGIHVDRASQLGAFRIDGVALEG